MTANEIIGSLVYRTNKALNGNQKFLDAIKEYHYYPTVANDNGLHLWHFPGTNQEISQVFQLLSKDAIRGGKLKFPGLLNFQSVIQEHGREATVMRYNLAIVAPVWSEWTTQQREEQVYKLVLKPIEDEFINQVERFPHFQTPMGKFPYTSLYVPTTGRALNSIMKIQYGDFLDAVELPNLSIKVSETCSSMSRIIVEESKKVTDEIKNLLN
jgi:hypothetical protein